MKLHCTHLHSFRYLVNILGFNDSLQVILQYFCEEILKLRASEVGQDFCPVWGILQYKAVFYSKYIQGPHRGQKYFNIALVLQDERLKIFTLKKNNLIMIWWYDSSCKYIHLSFKSLCNKEHKGVICVYVICLPRVILPKALVLQDECFGKNYWSFLDFTHNLERTSEIFVPCHNLWHRKQLRVIFWWHLLDTCEGLMRMISIFSICSSSMIQLFASPNKPNVQGQGLLWIFLHWRSVFLKYTPTDRPMWPFFMRYLTIWSKYFKIIINYFQFGT